MASRIIVLRRKMATGRYELTHHAKDEMERLRSNPPCATAEPETNKDGGASGN